MNAKYSVARGVCYNLRFLSQEPLKDRIGLFDNFFSNMIWAIGAIMGLGLLIDFIHWFIVCNWYTGFGWY